MINAHSSAHRISMALKSLKLRDSDLIKVTQAMMMHETADLDLSQLTKEQVRVLSDLNLIKVSELGLDTAD